MKAKKKIQKRKYGSAKKRTRLRRGEWSREPAGGQEAGCGAAKPRGQLRGPARESRMSRGDRSLHSSSASCPDTRERPDSLWSHSLLRGHTLYPTTEGRVAMNPRSTMTRNRGCPPTRSVRQLGPPLRLCGPCGQKYQLHHACPKALQPHISSNKAASGSGEATEAGDGRGHPWDVARGRGFKGRHTPDPIGVELRERTAPRRAA